jgi:D-alanyl-D-alanine carboxypeptidase
MAALSAVFAASAPAAPAEKAPDTLGPRLQKILDRGIASPETDYPGVAFYARVPGKGEWAGAAGTSSLRGKRALRPNDRFRAGSITKTFVATVTLQLAEEGRLRLDDPLPALLPPNVIARFPEADRITVRMLLNHTSGLAEYSTPEHEAGLLANPRRRWTMTEILDRAAALPRTGAPGERHSYANTNYNLLGLVIEQATGTSWRTVVRERIFDRLGMRHTSLPAPGTVVRGRDIVRGYETRLGPMVDMTNVDSSMAGAAGGNAQLTTTRDLARFLRALLDGRLFRERETLKAMRTFVPGPDEGGKDGYGLGIEHRSFPGGVEMVGHMGTGAGYRMFMFRLPKQKIDFTMATNTPGDPMPILAPATKVLVDAAS